MKRFLFLIVTLFFLIITNKVLANTLTQNVTENKIDFTFSVDTSGPMPNTAGTFELILYKGVFPGGEYNQAHASQSILGNNPISNRKTLDQTGKATWSVNVIPSTTYTARIVKFQNSGSLNGSYITEPQTIITPTPSITPTHGNLEFDFIKRENRLRIKGTFDLNQNPNAKDYIIQFQSARVPMGEESSLNALKFEDFTDTVPTKYSAYKGHEGTAGGLGVDNDGKYNIPINNLSPSVRYNIREIINYGGYNTTKDYIYVAGEGTVLANPQEIEGDIEKRSYRLLAPFPGFTVFLDPDLCAEQTAAGNTTQLCDINDILNLGLEILIGIAAVLLVFRIVFEGYKLLTSDIPFIKVEAKSGLWDAVFGLLLILFSYVLLNTINPRLVSGVFQIDTIKMDGVIQTEAFDGEAEQTISGKTIKVTSSKINYDKEFSNQNSCAGQNGTNQNPDPQTCQKIDDSIYNVASGKYVEKSFSEKLKMFNNELKNKNIPWRVTEAFPESRTHKATCHKTGVCIDMNHTTGWGSGTNQTPSSQEVKTVIETAQKNNMCAIYEILNNQNLYRELINNGLSKNVLFFNGKHISANHYSLYNGKCV